MLRTPRAKFAASPHAAGFKKLVQSDEFEEATLTALLELQREMPTECVPQQSVNAHQQMVGAKRYLEILCSLHVPLATTKSTPAKSLDYSAGV